MRPLASRLPYSFRYLLAFAIPLLIWLAVSIASFQVLQAAIDSSRAIARTQDIIVAARDYRSLASELRELERTFLITSAPELLQQRAELIGKANNLHARLAVANRGETAQQERLERAGRALQEWYYDVSEQRIIARSQTPDGLVRSAQLAERYLLTLLTLGDTRNADRTRVQALAALRSVLGSLKDAGRVNTNLLERAVTRLNDYERAADQGQDASAAAYLQELALLVRGETRNLIDSAYAVRLHVYNDDGLALITEFQESMTSFIAASQETLADQRAELRNLVTRVNRLLWGGFFLAILVMGLILYVVALGLNRSVRRIDRASRKMAEGNWSARVETAGRHDRLASRFNFMAELIERRNRETDLLAELGEALHSCTTIKEALDVFGRFSRRLFPEQAGILYLVEPNGIDATAMAHWRGGEDCSAKHVTVDECWGLRLNRTQENTTEGTLHCRHLVNTDTSLCIPLAFGEVIGMLFLVPLDSDDDIEGAEQMRRRQFSDSLAEQVALAFANIRLREKLRNQSIRDPLTQLYNRRQLDETIHRELHRAERHEWPLAVLAFDIDHFKNYNDEYGHDGGDAVLRCIGDVLGDFFRPEDSVFRSGGEEFVTLLPGTSLEDACARAEELRRTIAATDVIHDNGVLPSVTISIGVAVYPSSATEALRLLKAADRALYAAKNAGRNRVVSDNHVSHANDDGAAPSK